MVDYLGLKDEENLRVLLSKQDFKNAKSVIDTVWEERKIAAFGLWKLLLESKGEEALAFRKEHVMARDTVCTTYLCARFCPNKLEEFLRIPILESERLELINESLSFAASANDGDCCKILLDKGADPSHKNYLALRLACQSPNQNSLEGLRQGGLNLGANSDYCFKQAFANNNVKRLDYLFDHIKKIPIRNKEALDYLNSQNSEHSSNYKSLKWLAKKIDYTINFYPEELIAEYSYSQKLQKPPEKEKEEKLLSLNIKKIINVFNYFTLERCLDYFYDTKDSELLRLTQSVLKERRQKKALEEDMKREYEKTANAIEI